MLRLRRSPVITIQAIFLVTILTMTAPAVESADVTYFCKCVCAENSTIRNWDKNSGKLCSTDCNKAFCIDIMGQDCAAANSTEGCEKQITGTCFSKLILFCMINYLLFLFQLVIHLFT